MRRVASRLSGLLIGVLLLTAGGFWAPSALRAWKASWREQQYRATHQKPVPLIDPALAADPSVAPAQFKVIGPLVNSIQATSEIPSTDESAGSKTTSVESVASPRPALAVDHVLNSVSRGPVRLLHGKIAVRGYRGVPFVVPVQTSFPRLHGTFRALLADHSEGGNVDILVLNQQQFADFARGRAVNAVFTNGAATTGRIDVILNPTVLQPQKYYLVLSNPSNQLQSVDADFALTFD